jgi:hypothetical protein
MLPVAIRLPEENQIETLYVPTAEMADSDPAALVVAVIIALFLVVWLRIRGPAAGACGRKAPPPPAVLGQDPLQMFLVGRNAASTSPAAISSQHAPDERPRPIPRSELPGGGVVAVRTSKNELRLDPLSDTTADCTRQSYFQLPPPTDRRPLPYSHGPPLSDEVLANWGGPEAAEEALGSRARNVTIDALPVS